MKTADHIHVYAMHMNVPICIKLCDNIIVCACAVTVHIKNGLHSNTVLLQPVTPRLLIELCELAEAMKHLECFSTSSTLTCNCELASKYMILIIYAEFYKGMHS